MARILLTGANGFIGRAVLRRIEEDGHEPVPVGRSDIDLLNATEPEMARFVETSRVSHCIHAAWYTNHADYLVAEVNRAWVEASLRLAAGFARGGGRRFVALGTCLEYDQAWCGPFSESATPLRPDTLYARCKTALAEALQGMAPGLSTAWARIFFVYGPGDRAGRLIPYLVERLSRGEPVEARFGRLARDYIHVDDLAGQLVRLAAGSFEGAVNTGTGAADKLADIFRLAGELAGRPDLVRVNDSADPAQAERIEADMALFRARIGAPETRPLRGGIADLLKAAA
jgi:nucleoside-diphosphate-sugar epimerase